MYNTYEEGYTEGKNNMTYEILTKEIMNVLVGESQLAPLKDEQIAELVSESMSMKITAKQVFNVRSDYAIHIPRHNIRKAMYSFPYILKKKIKELNKKLGISNV